MAESKIAALRAASRNAPAAPSGPQALSYPWMSSAGRELVMPVRPPPASPKARRPPDPSSTPAQDIRKSTPPPGERDGLPPGYRRGRDGNRETSGMPGFVDGVTLPDGYNPNFRYNPDLFDVLAPRPGGQNLYGGMVPENPSVTEPASPPAPGGQPPLVDMDFGLLEYMRPNQRAELGPAPAAAPAPPPSPLAPSFADLSLYDFIQPVPVQGEAPVSAQPAPAQDYGLQDTRARIPPELIMAAQPPPAPADSGVAEAPPPPSMVDFDLLNYIHQMPGVELPPQQIPYQPQILEPEQGMPVPAGQPKVPPPPPGAPELQLDPELLRFLMMRDFGAEEAML
jgi:hypothetical protein